jgi:hypothetical protein
MITKHKLIIGAWPFEIEPTNPIVQSLLPAAGSSRPHGQSQRALTLGIPPGRTAYAVESDHGMRSPPVVRKARYNARIRFRIIDTVSSNWAPRKTIAAVGTGGNG